MKSVLFPIPEDFLTFLQEPFKDPFQKQPHPLAVVASELLQTRLKKITFEEGKMMGVLVVKQVNGDIAYLSAFSGKLNGHWFLEGFVPPVFNTLKIEKVLRKADKAIKVLQSQLLELRDSELCLSLKQELSNLERQHQTLLEQLKKKLKINKKKRHELRKNVFDQKTLNELSQQSQNDKRELKSFKIECAQRHAQLKQEIENQFDIPIEKLVHQLQLLSKQAQSNVFKEYQLMNFVKETTEITSLFENAKPPSGAGDCAAPKLLHYAAIHNLEPLALTEFWWGNSPSKEIRHHKEYYPPCRSKCYKILPFMLRGIDYRKSNELTSDKQPIILFEDDAIVVLDKPEHMLSIPGISSRESVYDWVKDRYPNATGPLLVHRLDQETSGILLVAKTKKVHQLLQKQFIDRTIKKRYVALLSRQIKEIKGKIQLPLRVDLDDRPRQLVCYQHGKESITYYQLMQHEGSRSRVYFYPYTGRTHQLRLHAAHISGLNSPIVGDKLYGKADKRMMLHAEMIDFVHPITGQRCKIKSKVPF